MYISIVCFIKLTSSYKNQKFVSLIDAPYFKNAFAPGASIRRNTVFFIGNPQYPRVPKRVFSVFVCGLFIFQPILMIYPLHDP